MNWKQSIFKPKWQHKNADIRLESVSTEQHPDLIGSLLDIARNDEDSRIRCAAVKRLHQLENILNLYAAETDPVVRSLLEDRIRQLASASNDSRPPLEFRMQVVETTSDRDLIEHIASHAPEAELRRAALARVERQGVLGDRCIEDSDAEIRRFAASRIQQKTTLKRVIGALRNRDKLLHSELQARLHEELLEQGEPKAVLSEAHRICSALEKHALEQDRQETEQSKSLHESWKRIADHASEEIKERYQRVCDRLAEPAVLLPTVPVKEQVAIDTAPEQVEEKATPEKTEIRQANEHLERVASAISLYESENSDHPRAAAVSKLKKQLEKAGKQDLSSHEEDTARWEEAQAALGRMEEKLRLRQEQSEKELDQAHEWLKQLGHELDEGKLHDALETRSKLQQLAKDRGKHRVWQQINSKIWGMQARLRELRDWQHWSNNKVRKRLIAEMEVLPAADLHPDALLDRVKSLQSEWKALEKSEQIPGEKKFMAAPWMWRKFSDAGHAAFDTAKPYLEKRTEIQSRHVEEITAFCAGLEKLAKAEAADWTAIGKGLEKGRKKLRDLNSLPPGQRHKAARQLKAALDKANERVQERYQDVESEKMKLIRAASQLIHLADRSEAIGQAKSLQSDWKAAGSLWRGKEQELWNQFRAHIDPLFEELKQQQATIKAEDESRLAAQKALCGELKEILAGDDDLSTLHGKVQGLRDSWKNIQHPDHKLLASFQDMVAKYEKRVRKAEQQQVEANRQRRWSKSALLHELSVSGRTAKGALSKKAEAHVTSSWPEQSSDDAMEQDMDQAFKDILAGGAVKQSEAEIDVLRTRARRLCIGLEFVAGLPSPEEEREQRMKYQVDRLAESMSGESPRLPAVEEARLAEKTWLGMYALPEADFKAFGKRIRSALGKILESI